MLTPKSNDNLPLALQWPPKAKPGPWAIAGPRAWGRVKDQRRDWAWAWSWGPNKSPKATDTKTHTQAFLPVPPEASDMGGTNRKLWRSKQPTWRSKQP